MAGIIGTVLVFVVLSWFLQRLFPALFAAVFVLATPVWLVGGLLLDLLRKLPAGLRRAWYALLQALGFLTVLPLMPFIFVWAFLAELLHLRTQAVRVKSDPPNQSDHVLPASAKRPADVIDLAVFRRRRGKE